VPHYAHVMGMLSRLFGRDEKPAANLTAPVRDAVQPPAPSLSKRQVATLILDAEEAAGSEWSFWVEGAVIAGENGYGVFDIADEYNALGNKRSDLKNRVVVTKQTINVDSLRVLDLSELESTRARIVGSMNYVSDAERAQFGGLEYLLVREPHNEHDGDAVAVYGSGRKVGRISAAKAASFAPILDSLGYDAYRVSGTSTIENSIRLWVDLPKLPALREFAKTQ
jgi:hypothetical protein